MNSSRRLPKAQAQLFVIEACKPSCLSMMLPGVAGWCHIYIYDLPRNSWHFGGLFVDIVEWWRCKTESYKTCACVNPVVPVVGLDEFRQHCQLVEQLLLRRCAEFYEGKGIPARRLGSLKAAANLAKDPCRATISKSASVTPRGSKRYVIEVFCLPCVLQTSWNCPWRDPQELADLDRQESSSLKSECRRLGVPAEHLRQQAWQGLHQRIVEVYDIYSSRNILSSIALLDELSDLDRSPHLDIFGHARPTRKYSISTSTTRKRMFNINQYQYTLTSFNNFIFENVWPCEQPSVFWLKQRWHIRSNHSDITSHRPKFAFYFWNARVSLDVYKLYAWWKVVIAFKISMPLPYMTTHSYWNMLFAVLYSACMTQAGTCGASSRNLLVASWMIFEIELAASIWEGWPGWVQYRSVNACVNAASIPGCNGTIWHLNQNDHSTPVEHEACLASRRIAFRVSCQERGLSPATEPCHWRWAQGDACTLALQFTQFPDKTRQVTYIVVFNFLKGCNSDSSTVLYPMLFPLASQVDALLIEKCEAWYERRGIPVRKLGSVKAAMTVAEKWEQLLGCEWKKLCGTWDCSLARG